MAKGKSATRLEETTIDVAQSLKLQQEIKSLKWQRLLSVFTAIASVVAFLILNFSALKGLFKTEPTISFNSNESFLTANARVSILQSESNKFIEQANYSLLEASKEITLPTGSYLFILKIQGDTLWQNNYTLSYNEKKVVELPVLSSGKIDLNVILNTRKILPTSNLDLKLTASGNGYLWIFNKEESGSYNLIFPVDSSSPNQIRATNEFDFGDYTLRADNKPGEETLLFIVTSLPDVSYAKKIQLIVTGQESQSIDKASVTQKNTLWGAKTVTYRVNKV